MFDESYENYIRSILGYPMCTENSNAMSYPNYEYTSNYRQNMNRKELEECYPEIYKLIFPMVTKTCDSIQEPITKELVEQYALDEEVLQIVRILSKPPKNKKFPWDKIYQPEEYFQQILLNWKATLIKIADRANNCSTMQVFNEKRKRKYILETKEYIYPLCSKGKIRYPEFSNTITILKNLIVSVCESLASILNMQDVITDETEEYKKTIHFIEGASRNDMPNTYKALFIAQKYHEKQTRTSGDPFIIHPLRVCSYLMALGIKEELVPLIQKAGYNLVSDLKDANAQKIQQQLGDIIKKYKLDITKPSVSEIDTWLGKMN